MLGLILSLIGIAVVLYLLVELRRRQTVDIKNKVVLITGCDTGFGNLTAHRLSGMGCVVLAGCLTEEGVKSFTNVKNVIPFELDITKQESIEGSFEFTKKHCPNGLWALINNAGIGSLSPMEMTTMETYRKTMEVNFFGYVAMTKQYLPLLKKSKGRIVNMASIAGSVSWPGMSSYTATKHAVRGWSDSIRLELNAWGVSVSVIQPGSMNTPILTKVKEGIENLKSTLPKQVVDDYGDEWFTSLKDNIDNLKTRIGDPQEVVNCYVHAIFSCLPKAYYIVGWDARLMWALNCILPSWIFIYVLQRILPKNDPKCLRK